MPNLNLDLDYFEHPKVRRLIGLLGRGAEVLPIRLWCYCGKYHVESGELTGYSAKEIESIVGWWGKEGEMMKAMTTTGFIEGKPGAFRIHDWIEMNGHLVAFKKRGKKAAFARWGIEDSNATSNAREDVKQYPNQPTNHPNQPTKPTGASDRERSDWFEEAWKKYPNRSGKKNALRHYLGSVKTPDERQMVLRAMDNYLKSRTYLAGYVKNGSTWFNEWADWVEPSELMMKGNSNDSPAGAVKPEPGKYANVGKSITV